MTSFCYIRPLVAQLFLVRLRAGRKSDYNGFLNLGLWETNQLFAALPDRELPMIVVTLDAKKDEAGNDEFISA